jgi:hypothetical protein
MSDDAWADHIIGVPDGPKHYILDENATFELNGMIWKFESIANLFFRVNELEERVHRLEEQQRRRWWRFW